MRTRGISLDHYTYLFLLKACGRIEALELGETIHGVLLKVALDSDSFVRNSLINMYTNCESAESARRMFDKMSDFNVVSCNAMIGGYVKVGDLGSAKWLFDKMLERDLVLWSTMIAGCVQIGDSKKAIELFGET